MSRLAPLVLALVFSSQIMVGQASTSKAADDAATAIPAVLRAQVDAWNRGDLKGFMDGYWKSPDLIFATGKDETRGWELVMERYHARYQSGDSEMGKLAFAWIDGVHVLSPELAYIDGEYRLTMSAGKESHGVFTLIFRKFPEGWRIVHDRTCSE
jgi:ketosteroid isomerase-like protein